MPVYVFTCEACGPFEVRRAVGDAAGPLACPTCGADARRRFTPPGVSRTRAPLRAARELEERSAHQPKVLRGPSGRPLPWACRHAHDPPWTLGH